MVSGQDPRLEAGLASGQGLAPLTAYGAFDQNALIRGVLHAVHCIDASQLCPVAPAQAGPAFQPKTLLTLLAYCYAVGILSSLEVEQALDRDPLLRLLCQNDLPNRLVISHFRSCNRHALRFVLHTACLSALHATPASTLSRLILPGAKTPVDDCVRLQALSRRVTGLIDSLIDKATWLDSLQPG